MQSGKTILAVIELRQNGVGYRTIRRRYDLGNSAVTLIMERFQQGGLTLDELKAMKPADVEKLFYPPENLRKAEKPVPDFEMIHRRMMEMSHPDLSFVWLEYKEKNPDGYQLSQFYKLYGDYVRVHYGQDHVTMPVERVPGERMYIDWVGDQPAVLADPETGELRKVHIFVTTLGFSSCVYAEIFLDEKLQSFMTGVIHALEYYHAVPRYLVPDNLKAAVTKHTRDELILNSVFSDLEEFYGVVILPPPARKPKGKATVENQVRTLETHLIERLKSGVYTSLDALNRETVRVIDNLNRMPFRKGGDIRDNRLSAFETYDKPRMKPLPEEHFTVCEYRHFSRIPDNYHLEYDGHYYSVPYTFHGKPAFLKATMTEIRICDENNRFICKHVRTYKDFPRYITDDTHMPAEHAYYKGLNAHDGAYYRRWAGCYGDAMVTLIDRILRSVKHEEQAYNSCNGILHLCTDIPRTVAEEAAQACLKASACKYTYFKKCLGKLTNRGSNAGNDEGQLPQHTNIRGRECYK